MDNVVRYRRRWRPRLQTSYTFTEFRRNDWLLNGLRGVLALKKDKGHVLNILQIGPGLVTRGFYHSEIRCSPTGKTRIYQKIESLIRKLPLPLNAYETFESKEIVELVEKLGFRFELTLYDISQKVLTIAEKSVHPRRPKVVVGDISQYSPELGCSADLVICCHVLNHVRDASNKEKAARNILEYAKVGALIVVDDVKVYEYNEAVSQVRAGVYRKI